jgi:hypothetical protein
VEIHASKSPCSMALHLEGRDTDEFNTSIIVNSDPIMKQLKPFRST